MNNHMCKKGNGPYIHSFCVECNLEELGLVKTTSNNKYMTLYDQLMFNWEKGFYSVVKNSEGYKIVSHKAPLERMWVTATCDTIAKAKELLGMCYSISETDYLTDWKIIDTIHPSELMGKGFQVGDKVKCVDGSHLDSRIFMVEKVNTFGRYTLENVNGEMLHRELKPVLPEKMLNSIGLKDCKSVYISGKGNCTIYDQETHKIIAIYKDGELVS